MCDTIYDTLLTVASEAEAHRTANRGNDQLQPRHRSNFFPFRFRIME